MNTHISRLHSCKLELITVIIIIIIIIIIFSFFFVVVVVSQAESKLVLDFSSLIGPLFYMWIFQLPFPLIISELVLEKENRIRQMMKLQGLDEISYMSATYLYHTVFYIIYAFFVFLLGVLLDLQFFLANSITLQILFYLLYGILQVKLTRRTLVQK